MCLITSRLFMCRLMKVFGMIVNAYWTAWRKVLRFVDSSISSQRTNAIFEAAHTYSKHSAACERVSSAIKPRSWFAMEAVSSSKRSSRLSLEEMGAAKNICDRSYWASSRMEFDKAGSDWLLLAVGSEKERKQLSISRNNTNL